MNKNLKKVYEEEYEYATLIKLFPFRGENVPCDGGYNKETKLVKFRFGNIDGTLSKFNFYDEDCESFYFECCCKKMVKN